MKTTGKLWTELQLPDGVDIKTQAAEKMKCHLLQDLIVLDALLQVLQVWVSTADRSHVGF